MLDYVGPAARLIAGRSGRRPGRGHAAAARAASPGPAIWASTAAQAVLERIKSAAHDHRLRQHPRPGRADVPGALEAERRRTCPSPCTMAAWTSPSAARSRPRWPRAACAPSSPPPRSISASTGAAWTRSCRSARRRASPACCNASAAPITGWTSPPTPSWSPPTGSRCWNARPPSQGVAASALDGDPPRPGGLDVLAQHILGMACAAKFHPDDLYREVITAAPYAALSRQDFDDVLRFVRGWRLRARGLRALPQAVPGFRRPCPRRQRRAWSGSTA